MLRRTLEKDGLDQESSPISSSTNTLSTVSTPVCTVSSPVPTADGESQAKRETTISTPTGIFTHSSYDDIVDTGSTPVPGMGGDADNSNMTYTYVVNSLPTYRINKDHPIA